VQLKVDFKYNGRAGELGKSATVSIMVNDAKVAEGDDPDSDSAWRRFDVGMDVSSPVDFTYKLPFKFTGNIEKVMVELQ